MSTAVIDDVADFLARVPAFRLLDAAEIRGLAGLGGGNADWAERAVREAVSLSASEALKLKVVDLVATDLGDLLKQIDGRTVRIDRENIQKANLEYEMPGKGQKAKGKS